MNSELRPCSKCLYNGMTFEVCTKCISESIQCHTHNVLWKERLPIVKFKKSDRNGKYLINEPKYMTSGASCMDISAAIKDPMIIFSKDLGLIPTGLCPEIPSGYELQIRGRSGLSIRNRLLLINGIGTIDEDYRGEMMVALFNLGDKSYTVMPGDRVAQMALVKVDRAIVYMTDELSKTDRGDGGFGHTGK